MFRSRTPTGRMVNTHVVDTDSIMHSKSSFSSTNRVRTPKHPYPHLQNTTNKYPTGQSSLATSSSTSLFHPQQAQSVASSSAESLKLQLQLPLFTDSSPTPLSRPQSPSIIEQHTADPMMFSQHAVIHSPKIKKNHSSHALNGGDSTVKDGSTVNSHSFIMFEPSVESVRPSTDPGMSRKLKSSSGSIDNNNNSSGIRSGGSSSRPKSQSAAIRRSHQPGFSFLGSTSDASIFDVIQYDNPISYRRVTDALDGRTDRIIPVSRIIYE